MYEGGALRPACLRPISHLRVWCQEPTIEDGDAEVHVLFPKFCDNNAAGSHVVLKCFPPFSLVVVRQPSVLRPQICSGSGSKGGLRIPEPWAALGKSCLSHVTWVQVLYIS